MGLGDLADKAKDETEVEEEDDDDKDVDEEINRLKERVKRLEREVFDSSGWESYMKDDS